ncbi:MAG: MFS transporter [Chloroflexota bacterium]
MATIAHPMRAALRWPAFGLGMGRDIDLLVLANLFWGIGNGFYTYLLPLYVARLGADPTQIGLVLALTSVVQALVYIPAGILADRLGRKPLMLFGWALGPVAMLVFSLAGTWQQLLPGVALLAAVAWSAPAYHSYIAASVGSRDMSHVFLMMFLGATAGATLSAPVGGWLGETAGLRWVFPAALIAYALSTVVIALLRPQPRYRPPAAETVAAPAHPSGSTGAARARPRRLRLRWDALPEVWSGTLAAALVLVAILMFATNLAQPFAPNWLVEAYGFSPTDIGQFGALSALGGAALAVALGRLQRRRGAQWALPLATAGLLAHAVLLLVAASWPVAIAAYLLRGVFSALPSLAVAIVAGVLTAQTAQTEGTPGGRRMGLGFALFNTSNAVALTLSTYAAGWLYGQWAPLPFITSAALLAPLLWGSWFAADRIARTTPTSTVGS